MGSISNDKEPDMKSVDVELRAKPRVELSKAMWDTLPANNSIRVQSGVRPNTVVKFEIYRMTRSLI